MMPKATVANWSDSSDGSGHGTRQYKLNGQIRNSSKS